MNPKGRHIPPKLRPKASIKAPHSFLLPDMLDRLSVNMLLMSMHILDPDLDHFSRNESKHRQKPSVASRHKQFTHFWHLWIILLNELVRKPVSSKDPIRLNE